MGQASRNRIANAAVDVTPPAPTPLAPITELVAPEVPDDYQMDEIIVDGIVEALPDDGYNPDNQPFNFNDDHIEPEQVRTSAPVYSDPRAIAVDLGPVTVLARQKDYIVRVTDDIGPVYYGDDIIAMQKNRKYKVPEHIRDWLVSRNMIYGEG